MRIIILLIFFLVLPFTVPVNAESQIPDWVKNNVEAIKIKGDVKYHDLLSVIQDFASAGLIKNTINYDYPIYSVPDRGETIMVKLSGGINDFGKSGSVSLIVTTPDKSEIELYTPVLETGKYLTYLPINDQFQKGTYQISAEFAGKQLPITYFYLMDDRTNQRIPIWFMTNFLWWINQEITDDEFLLSIQYLIDNQIMNIFTQSEQDSRGIEVIVSGQQAVRRGTTHTIVTSVSDGINPIEGARVTLTIEDYGEDIIREFKGFTNKNGDFVFSWEVPKSFDDIETLLTFVSVTFGQHSKTTLFKFQVYCLDGEPGCKVDGN